MAYIHHFCADTGCILEDLPKTMDDKDGWLRSSMISAWFDDDDDDILQVIISAWFDDDDILQVIISAWFDDNDDIYITSNYINLIWWWWYILQVIICKQVICSILWLIDF